MWSFSAHWRFRHQCVEVEEMSPSQPFSLLVFARGYLELGSCGTGVTGFYSIPHCCCTRTAPPLALCVCVPLHIGLFKHCGVAGRAGPMHGGAHRASPQALGNILGIGVRQMRSAVPSVGYRNWVVLKEMLYKGLKLAGWKKKSAKYSRLSVDTSRLPPEGEGSLIIVF